MFLFCVLFGTVAPTDCPYREDGALSLCSYNVLACAPFWITCTLYLFRVCVFFSPDTDHYASVGCLLHRLSMLNLHINYILRRNSSTTDDMNSWPPFFAKERTIRHTLVLRKIGFILRFKKRPGRNKNRLTMVVLFPRWFKGPMGTTQRLG